MACILLGEGLQFTSELPPHGPGRPTAYPALYFKGMHLINIVMIYVVGDRKCKEPNHLGTVLTE